MSSSPEKYFIFGKGKKGNEGGGREIFPKGYPKVKGKATPTKGKGSLGTFMMVDGENSYPAKYIEHKKTWIPEDVSDFNSKVNREASYNQVLIFFAEIWYGAKWNPDKAQLEITEQSQDLFKAHGGKAGQGIQDPFHFARFVSLFKNMDYFHHQISSGSKKSRITTDADGLAQIHGIDGFGKDMYQRYKRVVQAYNNPKNVWTETNKSGIKPIVGKKLTTEERERMKKRTFQAKPAEIEEKWRANFYAQPYIKDWFKIMDDLNIETAWNTVSGIARVFLINNLLDPKEFKKITVDAKDEPDDVKIKNLKKIVAIWKRWSKVYATPESYYNEKWRDDKYDKEVDLEFPQGLYEALQDFSQRDHKTGLPREFNPVVAEETARKSAADYLVAFITYAPEGSWSIADQPSKTMLSRKTPDPLFAEHGAEIDDKQVREGMKFLETGKRHHWQQKKESGKLVFRQVVKFNAKTQKEETDFEPVNELVRNDDDELHYNPTLKEYQKYGEPYSPLSPASLLFRLSILAGWRKAEALTATTRIKSKSSIKLLAKQWEESDDQDEKPSGISINKETGMLKITFLTRKTKKRGAKGSYFTMVIPPFSSSVMDTRETIELICKKAGQGKWKNTDYYTYKDVKIEDEETKKITHYWVEEENKKWIAQIIDLDKKELDDLFPALDIKSHGRPVHRAKGTPSNWLIGDDGQFYRAYSTAPSGNEIPTYDLPDGTGEFGLSKKEEKDMVRAYIDFPLMECYAVMSGTTVSKNTDAFVMDQAKQDHKIFVEQNKKHKTFTMIKGWSTVCSDGCPESDIGKKQAGKYSKERMDQDRDKYKTADEDYWLNKSIHSLRHLFAQLWLRKSKWNFGVVADRGHWETLDTLKKHYGGVPDETLGDFMTEVLASDQVGANKMDQAVNRSIALRLEETGDSQEIANVIKEEDVPPTPEIIETEEIADV